jgi:hypothetical protein
MPVVGSIDTRELNNALPEDGSSDPIAIVRGKNSTEVEQTPSSAKSSDAEHALAVSEAIAPAEIGKEGSVSTATKNDTG